MKSKPSMIIEITPASSSRHSLAAGSYDSLSFVCDDDRDSDLDVCEKDRLGAKKTHKTSSKSQFQLSLRNGDDSETCKISRLNNDDRVVLKTRSGDTVIVEKRRKPLRLSLRLDKKSIGEEYDFIDDMALFNSSIRHSQNSNYDSYTSGR